MTDDRLFCFLRVYNLTWFDIISLYLVCLIRDSDTLKLK